MCFQVSTNPVPLDFSAETFARSPRGDFTMLVPSSGHG
jgi:hypothetical protein